MATFWDHTRVYCSLGCKAETQRDQKPITKGDLVDLYLNQGLSTYRIGKLVDRDPKRVWKWLKDFEIPRRTRSWSIRPNTMPYHDKAWLEDEYVNKQRSASEIAESQGKHVNTILFFLQKHGIPSRSVEETRAIKYWGASGPDNPMFGKKGELNHNWKGGITPERQAFYSSQEWNSVAPKVRKRDRVYQRCGAEEDWEIPFHIHHIVSFMVVELRAELGNLILICEPCHNWVHSNENVDAEFIKTA